MVAIEYTKEFFDDNRDGSLRSAQEIIPIVLEFVRPHRVVELGCGVGAWLAVLRSSGVEEILGVDGDYVNRDQLLIPRDCFLPYNLEQPFRIEQEFDLAIALEVAEHLSPSSAEPFVDSLMRLAPVVLFSAAIPFQRGTHHLNEQWPDFWARLFLQHGFMPIDCIRERVWQNDRVQWWYAQNILIYAKAELVRQNPVFKERFERSSKSPLRLVHPERYLDAVDPARMRVRGVLPLVRRIVMRSIRWHGRRLLRSLIPLRKAGCGGPTTLPKGLREDQVDAPGYERSVKPGG